MPRQLVPPWLRRALEAAVVAAVVAVGSLVGAGIAFGGPYALPAGLPGVLLLAPAVLAVAVLPAAYPVGMAATRGDAVLGSIGGFLVAADLTIVVAGGRIILPSSGAEVATGLFAAALAGGPAVVGLLGGQLLSPLGFGRRAGVIVAIATTAAAVLALLALALGA